jgi:hypothetical protein
MTRLLNISITLLIPLLLSGCISIFKLSDLKPENTSNLNVPSKARTLLTEMGQAHGIEMWENIETYNVIFGDEFYGFYGKQSHPFKEQNISFSLNYIPKTFNGQLQIITGKEKGEVWGIQSGQTYTKNKDGKFEEKKDSDMAFWIPTYQYFIEFPNRIQEATALEYLGSKVINGIKTEGVIASWNTVKPQKGTDQYIIWIDSNTKRIVKIEYTVRDMYRFITGAAYFKNYKYYNGILLPSEYPVESNLVKDGYLHQMSIQNFRVNQISKDSLLPIK